MWRVLAPVLIGICADARGEECFVTTTFGNTPTAEHAGTLKIDQGTLRFDLSALLKGVSVQRAVLRFPFDSGYQHAPVRIVPVGVSGQPLRSQAPDHRTLNATEAVRAWVANPDTNRGLKVVTPGRAEFQGAVLEVSYLGAAAAVIPSVAELKAEDHDGQTFLTWREPHDAVGRDAPTFEQFEKAVLDVRRKRELVYRVYRHAQPITPASLGEAEIVREVPEAISCWNLLAIANTEHPQQGVTKRSPLRDGNLRLAHDMTRYRLSDAAQPLPRATGLAVLTAKQPGRSYYAVTVVADGRESVAGFSVGRDLAAWVRENPAVELPFWVCAPAYGAFPDHTLGDFGFKPWQEFITAMKETRRAFSAVWMSNGPGLTSGVCRDVVPKIRLHQSLPAFSNCSLDTNPMTDHPKGSYMPGRFDEDFQKHADKEGGINLYQRWEPDDLIDEAQRWEVTVWLAPKDQDAQYGAPAESATMDLTPRRCQRFKPRPGETFRWSRISLADGHSLQSGTAAADAWGLVTLKGVVVSKAKSRIRVEEDLPRTTPP